MATKKKVDWEKLAKDLQKALEKEMDEHEILQNRFEELEDRSVLLACELLKAKGVIEYLEKNNEDS